MNPYNADLWALQLFCKGKYQLEKDWNSLKKDGSTFLQRIIDNCPSRHEQEYNTWVMSKGMKHRTGNKKQEIIASSIYISFLNDRWNNRYVYYTIAFSKGSVKIVATQKHRYCQKSEDFRKQYTYVLFDDKNIRKTGEISGPGDGLVVQKDLKEIFEAYEG